VRLRGRAGNRDGLGAQLHLVSGSGKQQWNSVTTAVGYSSASPAVAHFGLGSEAAVKELEVRWPSGKVQRVPVAAVDRYLVVEEP
jgi:hypothetical protein